MNTAVIDRPLSKQAVAKPPVGAKLLEAVALALEARGSEKTTGYDGIEHRNAGGLLKEPSAGTIFGWIAEELADLGVKDDMSTVGGTLTGLGITGDKNTNIEDAQHKAAHLIGCNCHGAEITAAQAAARVRGLADHS